jgi:hypothetical protein
MLAAIYGYSKKCQQKIDLGHESHSRRYLIIKSFAEQGEKFLKIKRSNALHWACYHRDLDLMLYLSEHNKEFLKQPDENGFFPTDLIVKYTRVSDDPNGSKKTKERKDVDNRKIFLEQAFWDFSDPYFGLEFAGPCMYVKNLASYR